MPAMPPVYRRHFCPMKPFAHLPAHCLAPCCFSRHRKRELFMRPPSRRMRRKPNKKCAVDFACLSFPASPGIEGGSFSCGLLRGVVRALNAKKAASKAYAFEAAFFAFRALTTPRRRPHEKLPPSMPGEAGKERQAKSTAHFLFGFLRIRREGGRMKSSRFRCREKQQGARQCAGK